MITNSTTERVSICLENFVRWLERFGEDSWDHQSFFAGKFGGWAKKQYYKNPPIGVCAVAPMIFCEAVLPSARCLFHRRVRFPIADAHYAMGFAYLYSASENNEYKVKAEHFAEELENARCNGFGNYCWGYPFDWVTRNGTIPAQTPMITSTPYAFEAFLALYRIEPSARWMKVMESIARHASEDIKEFPTSEYASSCSYTPNDQGGVINAAAYRAFLLTSAALEIGNKEYAVIGNRNLQFVLENQKKDGSWSYAVDGVRDFVDHFHTCFVLKALAKVYSMTRDSSTLEALARGVSYYMKNLFDSDGLPKPFARAPRITVYKRELYDCAECINLCLLIRGMFPEVNDILRRVVTSIMDQWIKDDGSFRARRLRFGWDNVPMHRWGQSQMFRSLACYLREETLEE